MKKLDYFKIIGSFIGMAILGVSLMRALWIGRQIDNYVFSYLFGLGKYIVYASLGLVFVYLIFNKEKEIRKTNIIIGSIIFILSCISIASCVTTDHWGTRGIDNSVKEFKNTFSNYTDTHGYEWFSLDIKGGIIGAFLSGVVGYATVVISLIVYSGLLLIGISLVLWGTYSDIYKKMWKGTGFNKRLSWKNINGKNIKKLFIDEEKRDGIKALEEENAAVASHSKIDFQDKNPFIELEEEDLEINNLKSNLNEEDVLIFLSNNKNIETFVPESKTEIIDEIQVNASVVEDIEPEDIEKTDSSEVEIMTPNERKPEDKGIILPYGEIKND